LIENAEGKTMLEIVVQEILQNKITAEMPVEGRPQEVDSEPAVSDTDAKDLD
jgi:hypothetical protein